MVLEEVRIWHFWGWNSWVKLTEDCIVKTKHDDLLLYSFANSAKLVQLPSLYDFYYIVKKLQKRLAGFYKIESASYREIKLCLTAKKHSYDKRKQESKQVVGFQIFSDSIFVWFIPSRSWNLMNCYYNPSPHRLLKPMVPFLTWFKHLSLFLCQQADSLSAFDLWAWSSSGQLCGFSP